MSKRSVQRSIEINAPASKVWQVFTDPLTTRQMGGEYVSDWKVGSAFGWKAPDGKMLTNGTILEIDPERLLKHNLLNPDATVISVITSELRGQNVRTILHASEHFMNPVNDKEYAEAVEGWDAALISLKAVAEKNLNS
ncbi:MAG: SRPBCC domain-containing protein [Chloroflexota bacterium]|nr:SRPBCC domain-containing protein [Chloroflexota bacterium]